MNDQHLHIATKKFNNFHYFQYPNFFFNHSTSHFIITSQAILLSTTSFTTTQLFLAQHQTPERTITHFYNPFDNKYFPGTSRPSIFSSSQHTYTTICVHRMFLHKSYFPIYPPQLSLPLFNLHCSNTLCSCPNHCSLASHHPTIHVYFVHILTQRYYLYYTHWPLLFRISCTFYPSVTYKLPLLRFLLTNLPQSS